MEHPRSGLLGSCASDQTDQHVLHDFCKVGPFYLHHEKASTILPVVIVTLPEALAVHIGVRCKAEVEVFAFTCV